MVRGVKIVVDQLQSLLFTGRASIQYARTSQYRLYSQHQVQVQYKRTVTALACTVQDSRLTKQTTSRQNSKQVHDDCLQKIYALSHHHTDTFSSCKATYRMKLLISPKAMLLLLLLSDSMTVYSFSPKQVQNTSKRTLAFPTKRSMPFTFPLSSSPILDTAQPSKCPVTKFSNQVMAQINTLDTYCTSRFLRFMSHLPAFHLWFHQKRNKIFYPPPTLYIEYSFSSNVSNTCNSSSLCFYRFADHRSSSIPYTISFYSLSSQG